MPRSFPFGGGVGGSGPTLTWGSPKGRAPPGQGRSVAVPPLHAQSIIRHPGLAGGAPGPQGPG